MLCSRYDMLSQKMSAVHPAYFRALNSQNGLMLSSIIEEQNWLQRVQDGCLVARGAVTVHHRTPGKLNC